MQDIKVQTWTELMEVLYDIPKNAVGRHRSNFVYRGLADESWDLDTSLYRLGGDYMAIERPMLRSFKKYAEPGSVPADNIWVHLAIAQHHGLPTRVLDWTTIPRVAAHFATAEGEHYQTDGVIWCLEVGVARELLPNRLRSRLNEEYAWLFSVEMLDFIPSLAALDQLDEDPFLLFFEPPSITGRLVNQGAILSAMPGAGLRLSDFLRHHPDLFRRVIIPSALKWEVRDKLDQDNMTERILFPGLDGLSRWLRRYYGPGPKASVPASL